MERLSVESVSVIDWRDYGPAKQVSTEDDVINVLPDREAVVVALTSSGRRFYLKHSFGIDFELAERTAAFAQATGVINLDRWNEGDPVYGSEAYQASGSEEAWRQREQDREFDYPDSDNIATRRLS